jgi:anti-anti-sigma factor
MRWVRSSRLIRGEIMIEHSRTFALGAPVSAWPRGTATPLETYVRIRAGTTPVVVVFGELDIATVDAFRRVLRDTIRRYGPDVVVDAAGVSFCDACGIGAIVHAANTARQAGGSLRLADPSRPLSRVLRIVGLHRGLVTGGAAVRRPFPVGR